MADTHIKVGGSWKAIDNASVKVSGAWKQVDAIYIKVSGAWKKVWENITVTLSGHTNTASTAGSNASASFKISSDGNIYESDNGGADQQIDSTTDWIRPTSEAGNYEWRWTNAVGDTGDVTATTAEDTWTSSTLEVTIVDSSGLPASKSVTFDFQVRHATTLDTVTGSYTLTANRDDS